MTEDAARGTDATVGSAQAIAGRYGIDAGRSECMVELISALAWRRWLHVKRLQHRVWRERQMAGGKFGGTEKFRGREAALGADTAGLVFIGGIEGQRRDALHAAHGAARARQARFAKSFLIRIRSSISAVKPDIIWDQSLSGQGANTFSWQCASMLYLPTSVSSLDRCNRRAAA